jgi:hypothetical protein
LSLSAEAIAITVISRTAYPQFKRYPSNKELHELYTPTVEEIKFVTSRTRSKTGFLGLMVMLKMVEMFLKRIKKIHNNAKTKLEYLREKYLNQTQTMLEMFGEILIFSDKSPSYTQLGLQVQGLLDSNGGTPLLLEQYSEIASVNTKDYFPLLWSFYSPYRKALFDLVRSL